MIMQSSAIPDEDVLEMPKSWKRHLHPRRGGAPGPTVKVADLAEGELRVPYAAEIEKALGHQRTDPALAAAAREHMAATTNPLGAAVVAAIPGSDVYFGEMTVRFVDSWITTYGLPFAVHAFLERCDIGFGPYGAGESGLHRGAGGGFDAVRLDDAARRLRALLAVAGEDEYRNVVTLLAELRTTPIRQMISAYLMPAELEWVAECCAAPANAMPRELLLRSLGSPEHLELLGSQAHISVSDCYYLENLIALAEGVGPAIAPYLAEAFDEHHGEPRRRKGLLDVLGRLPSDEAFRLMLERAGNPHMRAALRETMRRFPVRAIRVLAVATTAGDATAEELLTDHLRADAELVTRVLPELPAEVGVVVEKLSTTGGRVPEASADELPRLLADPPWARTGPKPEPVVLNGLTVPEDRSTAWAPGERDAWLRTEIFHPYPASWHKRRGDRGWGDVSEVPVPQERSERWERWVAEFQAGRVEEETSWLAGLFAMGPEELIRPVLREWRPGEWERAGGWWSPENWLRFLIARFELDALPAALRFARAKPVRGAALLLPLLDGEVANVMADWLLRTKTARESAVAWFGRHGRDVTPHLVPVALGKAGRTRTAAEHALIFLAGREGKEAVLSAVRGHGERAVALVEALLSGDQDELPSRKKIPADLGVDAEVLPQVLLRGEERALPVPAVRHLLTLLAISTVEEPDPGLASVLEACDEASLAAFGWALFRNWQENGARPEHAWQFSALGRLGDDEVVRGLVPLIRAWPGADGHHHAVRGLDVLALIGSELALREVHGIAQKVKYKGLKRRAQEKVEQIAAARGLTAEQLGDRLVPDFGLDTTGTLILDYGPRRFVAGFDETLRPYVVDESGRRRASLPKPGTRDDAALAPAAYQRFADLKKDVRAIAGIQLQRLELAMVTGRRWSGTEFREFFVEHPLVWHIARRLVWIAEHGGTATAFRLAEDRTFAGVTDDEITPPDDAMIGIAHPLHLGDSVKNWSEVFADYEILQPFPQLGRTVLALTEEEKAGARLARFEGLTVPFGNVLRLERRGWHRGPTDSDGGISCFVRPVHDGRYVVVTLATGLFVGYVSTSEDQTFEAVWIGADPAPGWHSHQSVQDETYTFAELDPITASEVLTDLESVIT